MLRRFAPACKSTILIRVKARSLMGSVIVAFIIVILSPGAIDPDQLPIFCDV